MPLVTRRTARKLIVAIAAVVAAAAAATAIFYHLKFMYPRKFEEVVPARLYRGGQPTPAQLERIVREKGIRTFVNLRHKDHWQNDPNCIFEREFAEKHGLKFVGIALALPPTDEQVRQALDILDDEKSWPVLVHCSAGIERSGMIVAIYRIERQGWTSQRALDEMLSKGVPRTTERAGDPVKYVAYLRAYVPRFPKAPAAPAPPSQ
jgi:protein tyrosine/serine phosphatase